MINVTYDNGTIEPYTIVLAQRDYTKLGQISNISHFKYKGNLNSANEISFNVNKLFNDHKEVLWDEIFDLRLVWIKELDEYFQITVEITDKTYMEKTIVGTSLCEAELSQVNLYNIEINTETDISRDDYDPDYPTVFYRNPDEGATPEDKEKLRTSSLLHRILEKVPAYSIKHVDESLKNIQRLFSISEQSVYDFLIGDCASQFNCIFIFDSTDRSISVYDLYTVCETPVIGSTTKKCGYRGDFTDVCPKCGGKKLKYFGEDTTILVSTENLTDEVRFETDVDSIKNCFRLEAGDDDMTAAIINSNPNGSRYIYEFSPEVRRDMPKELVDIMDQYDTDYNQYNNVVPITINSSIVADFNNLCDKYNNDSFYENGSPWETINNPIVGYANLIPFYYECIEFYSYLKSSLMPKIAPITGVTPSTEASKLTVANIGDIGISKVSSSTSVTTVNSAMINWAKVLVKTGIVKVEIDKDSTNSFTYVGSSVDSTTGMTINTGTWIGRFKITNVEDETDFAYSPSLTITVTDDLVVFMKEKIGKLLKKNTEELEEYDVLNMDVGTVSEENNFIVQLRKWSSARLFSFYSAVEAVLGVLIEADQGKTGAILYDDFYLNNYYKKLQLIQSELDLRNQEINLVWGNYDDAGMLVTKGVIQYITEELSNIHNALNFKEYLKLKASSPARGEELYIIYTTYIREETYSNSNYISDDLDNNQLFNNARLFFEIAREELHKSATYQHSITSNINNLLAIPEFEPIKDKFDLGNWIRVQQDELIYRLRLVSWSINSDNKTVLNTEFSDVTRTANGLNDIESILKQASSMASSYGFTEKQAEKGAIVKNHYIDEWVENGLNSSLVRINNNDDEDISIDNVGITAKSYDDITDSYSDEQLRITHNVLAFTDDNWETVRTAVGKFNMTHYHLEPDGKNHNASDIDRYDTYGVVADAVLAGVIVGSHIESGTMIASYLQNPGNNNYIDLSVLSTDASRDFIHTDNFQLKGDGRLVSSNAIFQSSSGNYINLSTDYITYPDIIHVKDASGNTTFSVDKDGNANVRGAIYATSGRVGGWIINPLNSENIESTLNNGALSFGTPGTKNSALLSPCGYKVTSTNSLIFGGTKSDEHTWVQSIGQNFAVDNTGKLYASNVDISGTIKASGGEIGGWDIQKTYLQSKVDIGTAYFSSGKMHLLHTDGNTWYQACFNPVYQKCYISNMDLIVDGNAGDLNGDSHSYGSTYVVIKNSSIMLHKDNSNYYIDENGFRFMQNNGSSGFEKLRFWVQDDYVTVINDASGKSGVINLH